MATRRILQVIPTLDRSGAEKQLALLAAGLPRDEFDTHVAVLTRDGPLRADLERAKVPTTLIGKRWKVDPGAYLRLKRLIERLRPDLVHTWLFAAHCYGRVAASRAGVPRVVAGERCVDPWKRWHELAIDRRLARRTDRIVVNSSGVRDFYTQAGIPAEKFTIIPNGVEGAAPFPYSRAETRSELGLPSDAKLIAAIGRLWPQKKVDVLIWATDLLKTIRDDVHLLVLGDGPLRARLERFARQARVDDRVHFLGRRDDVPKLLPACDMLWLASEFEGLPNVILEAMAAGLPVVATDIPGNRDLVTPEQTGYLVPLGDRAAFARMGLKIIESPELASRLGAAGKRRAKEEFSVAGMISAHVALYRELLG